LLKAGVKLFSDRGYDGVAVDEIVALAGCNKRMLYHYFGNKDGLYVEVLRVVFSELEGLEIEALVGDVPTGEAIRRILKGYFAFLEKHPEFVSLLMWENLHRGRFLDAHPHLLTKSPVIERLREVIERARVRGEIDRRMDVRHLLVLLYGACFIYHSNRYTLRHTVGLDFRRPAVLRAGLQLAQNIFIRGLLPSGRNPALDGGA
jgi:TetR/AcrR family transcriptional regulator